MCNNKKRKNTASKANSIASNDKITSHYDGITAHNGIAPHMMAITLRINSKAPHTMAKAPHTMAKAPYNECTS